MSGQKRNLSLMEELEQFAQERDRDSFIESRAVNLVSGVQNLLELIDQTYSEENAHDLKKRLLNGVKSGDPEKFRRGVKKVKSQRK